MDCAFFQKACLFRKPAFFAREESDYLDILASSVAFLNLNEGGTGEEKAKKRGTRKRRRTRFFPRSVIRVVLMCRYYYYHVAEWLYFIRLLLYTFTPARERETYVFSTTRLFSSFLFRWARLVSLAPAVSFEIFAAFPGRFAGYPSQFFSFLLYRRLKPL